MPNTTKETLAEYRRLTSGGSAILELPELLSKRRVIPVSSSSAMFDEINDTLKKLLLIAENQEN